MEEKLILGLPNDGKSIVAPANAFRLSDKEQGGRVKYGLIPALMIGAVGAELAEADEPDDLQRFRPEEDGPIDSDPLPELNVKKIEEIAAFLRQMSQETMGPVVAPGGNIASVRVHYAGSEPYSSANHMERLTRAFNDNDGRIFGGEDSFHFPPGSSHGAGGKVAKVPPKGPTTPTTPTSPDVDEDDGTDGDNDNRLPVSTGRSALPSTLMNVSALVFIGDLLRLIRDADGDPLSIQNLRASQGEVVAYGPGQWLYTPERGALGEITFSYQVSDGYGTITVQATMNIVKPSPREIAGTDGDDRLIGTPFEDLIDGRDGNDVIYGRESNDIIVGGKGDDTLLGGDGDDVLHGNVGRDIIFGGAGNDILFGEEGDDALFGEEGADNLMGGEGHDHLMGGSGNDRLFGDEGEDVLFGETGNDLLEGGAGGDELAGGSGNDVVLGETGNDVLRLGFGARHDQAAATDGNDIYSGGEGIDTLDASGASAAVDIDLKSGTAGGDTIGADRVETIENVVGTAHDDTIRGDDGDNSIDAGAGDDRLVGGDGDDVIHAEEGDDVIVVFASTSNDDDDDDDGDDIYDGGDGIDTIDLTALVEAVIADMEEHYVEGAEIGRDTITSFEIIRGGRGSDVLSGGSGSDILHGGAGDDRLKGREGDDILVGGSGNDVIEGNGGNDTFLVFAYENSSPVSDGDDSFDGGLGVDVYDASATKLGVTIDLLVGRVSGDETGNDTLISVEAALGGSGNDILVDGTGVTIMTGGAGNDIFVFSTGSLAGDHRDEIRDFSTGDRVDLSTFAGLVFAGLGTEDTPQAGRITFHFEQLEDREQTVVRAIVDLEHDDEIEILLYGRYHLTEQDFMLAALELAAQESGQTA